MDPELQWDFFPYLPVVLQDEKTREVLMIQYMTQQGLANTLDEGSMWLWRFLEHMPHCSRPFAVYIKRG